MSCGRAHKGLKRLTKESQRAQMRRVARKKLKHTNGVISMKERKTFREIEKILKENAAILKEKFNVKELGIFGSYVRREQKNKSDVDILVEFYKPLDLFAFIEFEDFLSALLGIKVDFVMKSALKPRIKDKILKDAIYL